MLADLARVPGCCDKTLRVSLEEQGNEGGSLLAPSFASHDAPQPIHPYLLRRDAWGRGYTVERVSDKSETHLQTPGSSRKQHLVSQP